MSKEDRGIQTQAKTAPSARELAMVVFRHKKLFLFVSGLVFACGVACAFAGASYRAQVRILVRRGRADPPAAAQQNAPPDLSRVEVSEEELNSEVELLKDDDVLQRVVEATGLADHDWLRWMRPHEGRKARVERAARRLADQLKVESIKKTHLIAVAYEAADPHLAANVLKSLSMTYLEKHTEVHRPSGQLHFFDQQTVESRRQLEDAQRKLLAFTQTRGVVVAAQQRDLLLQRLDAVEGSYLQGEVEMSEAERRVQELKAETEELPQRTTTQIRTANNPELLRALRATLLDLEMKKTQLLTKYEPTHRLVQEVDVQISQANVAIEAEKTSPLRDETTDKNADYEWAMGELQKARVNLKGLEARQHATSTELIGSRKAAVELGEDAIEQEDLRSSATAAQENYLLYVKKREESRVGDALDDGGIVNVAIAEEAVAPALPVWSAGTVALLGLVAAIITGAGTVFTADYLDPALRTPEEVFGCLEIPVLASIPARCGKRLSA